MDCSDAITGKMLGGDALPEESLKEQMTCATTGRKMEMTYLQQDKIGAGTFGHVFQIKMDGSEESYALKKVFEKRTHMNRELEMLRTTDHPSIIRMFWFFYGEKTREGVHLNIVMEYIRTDLHSVIQDEYAFTRDEYIEYAVQFLDGLEYLHALEIAHRDIKPSNVLIDTERKILKICDLGSAKRIERTSGNVLYICSRYYRGPEIHKGLAYGVEVDVWSAGCVLLEMITHEVLFPGETGKDCLKRIAYFVQNQKVFEIIRDAGREDLLDCAEIIQKMLAVNPDRRISAREAHRLFREKMTSKK